VLHVDDLIEPRTKQILFAAFPPLLVAASNSLRSTPSADRESQLRDSREIPQQQFARKSPPDHQFPANQFLQFQKFTLLIQSLRDNSRTTK
jgi:hypothetical protein